MGEEDVLRVDALSQLFQVAYGTNERFVLFVESGFEFLAELYYQVYEFR